MRLSRGADPPDSNTPCHEGDIPEAPEGIIFRVDVPNGYYRFVASSGDAMQPHAHCILAEDGGSGPPEQIGPDHVFLVRNFDQAQYPIGEVHTAGPDRDAPGVGVYARIGFGGKIPPPGDDQFPSPQFVDIGADGLPGATAPHSPILEVTRGYVRIHQLQGNSNYGPGGFDGQRGDPNGGDLNVLELWRIRFRPFKRRDASGDGLLNVGDAVSVLRFLFSGEVEELGCHRSANSDDSETIDVSDAIYVLSFLFLGSAEPPAPFPDCGLDPTHESLTCEVFTPCENF